jgi:hypothetical protein
VPHFSQKAQIRDYIKEKHPNLKTICIEPGCYMQNWSDFGHLPKLDDGTAVFSAPLNQKAKLHLTDIDDIGPVVREILENPENFVGEDICICAEEISFEDVPKVFTKVTGIPATAKTLTEEEFRATLNKLSEKGQDDLFSMYKWFEEFGYYGKNKDWTNGQKLTKLNTFEQWLEKTGWKGY